MRQNAANRRRKAIIPALALLLVVAGALVGLPSYLRSRAESALDSDPCALGSPRMVPPSDGFFDALNLLDIVGRFPGFRESAEERADAATRRCVGSYTLACANIRFVGETRALESARARHDEALAAASTPAERIAASDILATATTSRWPEHITSDERAEFCGSWRELRAWLAPEAEGVCAVCLPDGG